MKRPVPQIEREEHPTLDTFERVLSSGLMVDQGPGDRRRAVWAAMSAGEEDVVTFDAYGRGLLRGRSD